MTPPTNPPVPPPSDDAPAITRISVAEARVLLGAGRGVLVDTRARPLFDNAHAAGGISMPVSEIEAGQVPGRGHALPPDRTLILYCA